VCAAPERAGGQKKYELPQINRQEEQIGALHEA
jgi:hypothetical protein